jgi:hypothetical protein
MGPALALAKGRPVVAASPFVPDAYELAALALNGWVLNRVITGNARALRTEPGAGTELAPVNPGPGPSARPSSS